MNILVIAGALCILTITLSIDKFIDSHTRK